MATACFGDDHYLRTTRFAPQPRSQPSVVRSVVPSLPSKLLYGSRMSLELADEPNAVVSGPVTSGNDDGNLSLTETDAITSQIEGHIFKSARSFDSFPSPLRLRSIPPSVFSELLCTSMYQKLSASDSHVRISYNSVTRILAVQCMTTWVHDAAQPFLNDAVYSNAILQPIRRHIDVLTGTDFVGFAEPYRKSIKQPDVAVVVGGSMWPTLVVESGWSKEYDDLVKDARLWLVGGRSTHIVEDSAEQLRVNAVILVHFDHRDFDADPSQPIKGILEVWRRGPSTTNSETIPDIKQSLKIAFYPSLPADAPPLAFSLQEILGSRHLPPNTSGDTLIYLDLEEFIFRINRNLPKVLVSLQLKREIVAEKQQREADKKREAEEQQRLRTVVDTQARDDRAQRRAGHAT